MSLEIKGRITKVLTLETGESKVGKKWEKQNFVIDTGSQYNPEVAFSVFGNEKVKMLESFGEGQEVVVAFNVSSREYNGKYYHNLDAWKINSTGGASASAKQEEEVSDDLPF
jgi:hypothetical protein